jgi:carboxymethylenebutenolidase
MCHGVDSLPAVPNDAGAAVTCERTALLAADGARLAAVAARPKRGSGAGVVILPDNRGLGPFYGALAERQAERGHAALAIDYYGRTAGLEERGADFPFMEHLMRLKRPGLEADLAAAVGYLRSDMGGACRSVFALGFCFGGRQAFLAGTLGHGLAGVVGFYGFPGVIFGSPGPTQRAADIGSPVLAIWGGGDEDMPAAEVAAFADALAVAGVEHEFVTYRGAPHSFFDVLQPEFAEASADAWGRTQDFIARHAA